MTARLNYGKTFLLGFGFFGVSVIWGVYNAFVPIFLADKFGLSPMWIGFFMTLDNIAALFIQPPVGAWSDRLRTKWGRRIPFILIGAPITALAFGFIPMAAVLPLFVACTSTTLLSAALWRTPVVALMPDITPSKFRSQANGVINFMGGVGTIIALQTGGMLYKMSPNFPFWLGSVLVVLAALVVFFFIEEPKEYEEKERQPGMLESLKEVINDPDKSGLRILSAIFFWFIGYSAVDTFFTLYAKNHLGIPEGDGATMLSVVPIVLRDLRDPIRAGRGTHWTAHHHHDRVDHDDRGALPALHHARLRAVNRRCTPATRGHSPGGRRHAHVNRGWRPAHAGRHRLGMHQHQLAAHDRGPDQCGTHRHIHRVVLSLLHPLCDRRTERQRLGGATRRRQLQHHHAAGAVLHDHRDGVHAGRKTRRDTNHGKQRYTKHSQLKAEG